MSCIYIYIIVATLLFASEVYAFNIGGKYNYNEKGYSGTMFVTETQNIPTVITVKIESVENEFAHTCSVEAKGERLISSDDEISASIIVTDDYFDEGRFVITFTPYSASIGDLDNIHACGIKGDFSGKWKKDGVSQPIQSNKEGLATGLCSEYIKIKKYCFNKAVKGILPNNAIKSINNLKYDPKLYNNACQEGYAAFGRVGNIKQSALNQALQSDYANCYNKIMKE